MGIIGESFVAIRPESSGFFKEAEGYLSGIVGKLGGPMVAGIGVALVGVAAGLATIGDKFDEQFDKIAIKTGATGKALEGLKGDFKNVLGDTAGSMEQVGDAISGIAVKTGLTGTALDDFAKKQVNLANITKTDVNANVAVTTDLFNKFGISAKDQSGALDVLFKASQNSGKSVGDLAGDMKGAYAVTQTFGFTFNQTAALMSSFEKAGFDASTATGALTKAFAKMHKEGITDVHKGLTDLIEKIKGAKTEQEASGLAFDAFGKKGIEMGAAIRRGTFDIDALTKSLGDGKGGINKTTEASEDFGEKWDHIKNKVLVGVEPIASKLFDTIGKGMDALGKAMDVIGPVISKFWDAFMGGFENPEAGIGGGVETTEGFFIQLGQTVKKVWDGLQPFFEWLQDHGKQVLIGLVVAIAPIPAALIYAWTHFEKFRDVVSIVITWIGKEMGDFVEYVKKIWPQVHEAIGHVMAVVETIIRTVVATISFIWDHFGKYILQVISAAWDAIKKVVEVAINIIKDVIQFVIAIINGDWGKAWDAISDIPKQAFELIVTLVKDALKILGSVMEAGWHALWMLITTVWDAIWKAVKAGLDAAWKWLSALPGDLLKLGTDAMTFMFNAIVTGAQAIWTFYTELPGKVVGFLGDLASTLWQKGKDLLQGMWNGIINISDQLVGWFQGLPGAVGTWLGNVASTLWGKGKDLLQGLWNGAINITDQLIGWFGGLPGAYVKWIGDVSKTLYETGRKIIQGLIDGLASMFDSVKNKLGELTGKMTSWKGPLDLDKVLLVENGRALIGGFMAGIDQQSPALKKQLGDLTSSLSGAANVGMNIGGIGSSTMTLRHDITINAAGADAGTVTALRQVARDEIAGALKSVVARTTAGVGSR